MSPHSPRMGNRFTRWLGSTGLKLIGWELKGRMPDVDKFLIIGVPHTSNWDAIAASLAMLAAGFKYTFLIKKEWFFWPLGPIIRGLGGYPVDRGNGGITVVRQLTGFIESSDKVCIGCSPEGTRSKIKKYKTGFLHVARAADVPVFICAFDGLNKHIVLDRLFPLTGNMKADAKAIKEYVDETWVGVHPERQNIAIKHTSVKS